MNIAIRIGTMLSALLLPCFVLSSQNALETKLKESQRKETVDRTLRGELDAVLVGAVEMMDKGDYRGALSVLDRILAESPDQDAAWYYSGLCCLHLKDNPQAQARLKKASELDPGNYWYKDRLAIAYSASGEDDLTVATFEELLKEHPKKNDIYYSLVNLYIKQNQLEKALEAMDQIETVFGKSENVTSTRYGILLRMEKPAEALKSLLDFNEVYSSPGILTQIGDHTMAEYKDSLALGYYEEALSLQSNYIPAILGKSEVFRIRRDYPKFISTLRLFIDDSESHPQAKTQYMDMLLRRSDPRFIQSLKPQLDSLVDLMTVRHPSDSSVLTTAGMYYFSTERKEKAAQLLEKNVELYPEDIAPAVNFVQFLAYTKDWDRLQVESGAAFERFPSEPAFLEMQNIALYNKGDYSGIIANCERIIGLFPQDKGKTVPALASLGDMLHQTGRAKEAFKTYGRALKLDPDNIQVLNKDRKSVV